MLEIGRRTTDVRVQTWRFISTSPSSGEENMRFDEETLAGVASGTLPPTVRFFRFANPTVTFGRLQKLENITPLIPASWSHAQRPTGGGVVLHENDLCISLCWQKGESSTPSKPTEIYPWIHAIIRGGLGEPLRMAQCGDVCSTLPPFETRECFTVPVGYDLMSGSQKVVGGAIRATRNAFLYQGSVQSAYTPTMESAIRHAFEMSL